jgi:hypothetical protein
MYSGAQKDLSEVIQIDNVFSNVSKGAVSPSVDLSAAFGTTDIPTIILEILKKGEIQVGEKERAVELEELRREIATEVAARCVDPGTQRPHTVGMIEKSMVEIGFSVNTSKSAKVSVSSSSFRRFVSSRLVVSFRFVSSLHRFVSSLRCFVVRSFRLVSSLRRFSYRHCVVLTFSHFVVGGIVV